MKRILLTVLIFGLLACISYWGNQMSFSKDGHSFESAGIPTIYQKQKIQNGDIIFQTSTSNQSKAIQLATNSKYSHMGIIYENDGDFFVYEAIQPVKLTPLKEWVNRGYKRQYVIKRLKNSKEVLTRSNLSRMKKVGERFKGKSYDIYFEWSDDKVYCSELVWKIYYEATGIELGKLEKLSDFDLSNEEVKSIMKQRYGNNVPMEEKVISPAAMFTSEKLKTVIVN
ncbi:MAG: YiiX family permuted papain-like enzyme [Bacteroidia bacterium]